MTSSSLSTWQDIALVVGPVAAAIAALASWASVLQSKRAAKEASRPLLQVQKIIDSRTNTVGAVITNAGTGAARGTGIFLTYPPFYVTGALGHGFLFPGDTVHVTTAIPFSSTQIETDVVVLCRDKDSVPHYWNAMEKHMTFKDWRGRPGHHEIAEVFLLFHPEVNLAALSQAEMSARRGR